MLPWLAYVRVSRVGHRDETLISPSLQMQRIEAYAAARGLAIEALPAELDVSGGKAERPILGEAIERVERGEAKGIIVAQLDRLSRMDIVDALRTIQRIGDDRVIAVAENFDAGTPEGRLGRNVFLAIGQLQLDRYRAQFVAAKQQAVRRGIWPAPIVPVGYRTVPRQGGRSGPLEPDPERAPDVVEAFERRAGGASWRRVGEGLGYGITGGRKVVTNRVYLGEIRLTVEGIAIVNERAHDPIVQRDLWEAAQIAHPRPPRRGNPPALLAGLIRCAGCRGLMTPDRQRRSGAPIYRCQAKQTGGCPSPTTISQRLVDPFLAESVLTIVEGARGRASRRADGLADAERQLAAAEAARDDFAAATAGMDREHIAAGMQAHVEAVEQARRRVVRERMASLPSAPEVDVRAWWQQAGVLDRRHLLRGTLSVVWVWRGRGLDRVRLIADGEEPPDLPRPGRRRGSVVTGVAWRDDLPGEVRPLAPEQLGEGPGTGETG